MTQFLSELFSAVRKVDDKKQKIELLRRYEKGDSGRYLTMALSFTYNSRYQFFTNTIPPYTADGAPMGLNPSTAFTALASLKVLLKNHPADFTRK